MPTTNNQYYPYNCEGCGIWLAYKFYNLKKITYLCKNVMNCPLVGKEVNTNA